jgi:hypothetical protein
MTPRVTLWRVCDPRHLIALTPVGAVDPASGIPQEDPATGRPKAAVIVGHMLR